MKLNIIYNSEDKSLSVKRDGTEISNHLSDLHFYAQNEAYTKFSVDFTEITRKEADEDGHKAIDTMTTTRASLAEAMTQLIPKEDK